MFYLRQTETDLFNQQPSSRTKLVINYLVSGDKDMKQSDIIQLSQLCASFPLHKNKFRSNRLKLKLRTDFKKTKTFWSYSALYICLVLYARRNCAILHQDSKENSCFFVIFRFIKEMHCLSKHAFIFA